MTQLNDGLIGKPKFSVGDKVVRTEYYHAKSDNGFMQKGNTYIIKELLEDNELLLEDSDVEYSCSYFELVQPSFKNMKFRVNSPEHSKEIQEALFEMGYKWHSKNPTTHFYIFDKVKYIYASDSGTISYDDSEYRFNNQHANVIETVVETTKSYKLIPVVTEVNVESPKPETIEIDGKTYDKEAVLKRLAELESIQ